MDEDTITSEGAALLAMSEGPDTKVNVGGSSPAVSVVEEGKGKVFSRDRYVGALAFNICSFILPAIYGTLAKLWVAQINSKLVVTTDLYTYVSIIVEVINEGLPRAAYLIIGDKSNRNLSNRLGLSHTLIAFQCVLGFIVSCAILGSANRFTEAFAPVEVVRESVKYVRIASFSGLFSALEVSVSFATRSLDRPDVPLAISSVRTLLNIILDVLIISKFRVNKGTEISVNTQAVIRLCCDAAGACTGLAYFLYISNVRRKQEVDIHNDDDSLHPVETQASVFPSVKALKTLVRPGAYFFTESAVRNALYLWLISIIAHMGTTYATAWGIFNTIRWGLVMVPVMALEATTATFVGHAWGAWRQAAGAIGNRRNWPSASKADILKIVRPALISIGLALLIEIPLCVTFSLWGARPFAYYLSGSVDVAKTTAYMWRTIDWCYIFYAVNTQAAAILLSTRPKYYLAQSLGANILWVLPWAIACQVGAISGKMDEGNAWKWHSIVFGGSLVFSVFTVGTGLAVWGWELRRGMKVRGARDL